MERTGHKTGLPLMLGLGLIFKRAMSATEFIRGQRDFIGAQLPG